MNLDDFLKYMNSGKTVIAKSEVHQYMCMLSQEAIRLTIDLNSRYHTPEEIRAIFSVLTGRDIDESFSMFPPFNTDCGKNIHIGKNVFINSGCKFQDQGGIYIDDGALIGHNAMLATLNHSFTPSQRANLIPSPIHIGKNVWLGANVTLLPGVTVGDGAIIAAGAVVSGSVPANSIYAGVPATFMKNVPFKEQK